MSREEIISFLTMVAATVLYRVLAWWLPPRTVKQREKDKKRKRHRKR